MIINNSNFKIKEIPDFHPIAESYERDEWWRIQKRRCMEGYWVSGKWMPPELYYYINFHNILFEDGIYRGMGLPWLRDIDWEKAYIYAEATGFSGFELDDEYTCHRFIKENVPDERILKFCTLGDSNKVDKSYLNNFYKKDGSRKTYVEARDYLRKIHLGNLGKPLYFNEAQHIIELASRGYGKSYYASGLIAHNFIFDGARDYDLHLRLRQEGKPLQTDTVVGAIDAKYSNKLIGKVKVALEKLPGSKFVNMHGEQVYFPSPLAISYTGSFAVGREAIATNSKSVVQHVTFADNPLAAAGGRPNKVFIDEVGFMNVIKEAWEGIENTQAVADFKRLTIYGMGTGGLTVGGAVTYLQEIFYNPEAYGCLAFDDKWENKGKIGYFVPGTMALNQFKEGPNLITNEEKALEYINAERDKAKKSKSSTKMQGTIINKPIVPSEIFLRMEGTYFPTHELKQALAELESNKLLLRASYKAELIESIKNVIKLEPSEKQVITEYPMKRGQSMDAPVEIFEKPKLDTDGHVFDNRYMVSLDPIDDDGNSDITRSLQSAFVLDAWTNKIVAEYTARTYLVDEYYENVRKLAIYYNARILYENNKKGFYGYMKNKNCLHMLAETPEILKDQDLIKSVGIGNRSLGVNVSNDKIKFYAINLILKWLESPSYNNPDKKNLYTIRSLGLLKELISFSMDINADRCVLKDTEIQTINGIKKIQELNVGDKVLTQSGKYNIVYLTHKNNFSGRKVSIRALGDYRELICTDNHPIFIKKYKKKPAGIYWMQRKYDLTSGEFINAENVQKGDFIFIPKRTDLNKQFLPEDLLYLLGWYISDGNASNTCSKVSFFFQYNQKEIAKDIVNILNKYFKKEDILVKKHVKKGTIVNEYRTHKKNIAKLKKGYKSNMWVVDMFSKELNSFVKKYGGEANNKRIHEKLYNTENLLPLLRGFFEGGGHYRSHIRTDGTRRSNLELSSVYKELIFQIRQILLDNGIWNTIRFIKKRNTKHKDQYNINISGNKGFAIVKDSKKFNQVFYDTNNQSFHVEEYNGFYVPVEEVKIEEFEGTTYNISVENDETYVANGILTHNCSSLMILMIFREELDRRIEQRKQTSVKSAAQSDFWGRAYGSFNRDKVHRKLKYLANYDVN